MNQFRVQPILISITTSCAGASPAVDAESVAMLTGMGFTPRQATAALMACNSNAERAGDWLFSRMDDLDSAVDSELAKSEQGVQRKKAHYHCKNKQQRIFGSICIVCVVVHLQIPIFDSRCPCRAQSNQRSCNSMMARLNTS